VIEDVSLSPAPTLVLNPDVSVSATRTRRRFTAAYKRQILDAAAACTRPGEIGALLRREGLYSSHLTAWRAADRQGEALTQRRGPAPTAPNPLAPRVAELERALAQATRRADRAELIVDAQKKFSALIGLTLPPLDASREAR
jgi:transposase-like protein